MTERDGDGTSEVQTIPDWRLVFLIEKFDTAYNGVASVVGRVALGELHVEY